MKLYIHDLFPRFESRDERTRPGDMCQICGAEVIWRQKHLDFHNKLENT